VERYRPYLYCNLVLGWSFEEFIQKSKGMRGFENSVRSAERGRALGLEY
jgi:hypothetical protein